MNIYITIITAEEKALALLKQLEKINPDFFPKGDLNIKGLKKHERRTIIFMNYGWETLTYVRNLRIKYPQAIRVYLLFGEFIDFDEYLPESCIKGSNWMSAKNGRKLSDVAKYLGIPKEELKKEVEMDKKDLLKGILTKSQKAFKLETEKESKKYEFQKIELSDRKINHNRKVYKC